MSSLRHPGHATVLLRHQLPDGSEHVDWMIDLDTDQQAKLATWRCDGAIHVLGVGDSVAVERIGDHRRDYLTYEGPVSNDRGEVTRLISGIVQSWEDAKSTITFAVQWDGENVSKHYRMDNGACVTRIA